ncbi:exostosin [Gorgonomyces haynaldii]|nr:exostosin [Gorgonomyces haynaldii]
MQKSLRWVFLAISFVTLLLLSTLSIPDQVKKQSSLKEDRCTLILTVYDRYPYMYDRLEFYQHLSLLDKIVIILNYPLVLPQTILTNYSVPVHILPQEVNSLNNRFYPWPEIETRCIINMDDDWNMPLEHIRQAVQVWNQSRTQIVGYKHLSRANVMNKDTHLWEYKTKAAFASIALPSGLVYDYRYLKIYSSTAYSEARHYVDQSMNCDDILFNMIVAHVSEAPPIFLDVDAKSIDFGGLWKRPKHFEERSYCLNYFTRFFDGMPLKPTTVFHEP